MQPRARIWYLIWIHSFLVRCNPRSIFRSHSPRSDSWLRNNSLLLLEESSSTTLFWTPCRKSNLHFLINQSIVRFRLINFLIWISTCDEAFTISVQFGSHNARMNTVDRNICLCFLFRFCQIKNQLVNSLIDLK